MTKKYFDYSDINLVPKMGIVDSRAECDTSVEFGGFKFKLPVYPANMESVINEELCEELASNGYFYTMHRFNVNQINFIKNMKSKGLITSISIGVNEDSYELLIELIKKDLIPDFITVDTAHGHSVKMRKLLEFLKKEFRDFTPFIIAGNICTVEAAVNLIQWGAHAVKCGIAPGLSCSTAMETGFGSRGIQASMIKEITDEFKRLCYKPKSVRIIADGGIRHRADIVKSLVMGADIVMCGGLFANLSNSPAKIDEQGRKIYHGSASAKQSGKTNRIEGITNLMEVKENTYLEELKGIEEALQSAISYAGSNKLEILKTTEYIIK